MSAAERSRAVRGRRAGTGIARREPRKGEVLRTLHVALGERSYPIQLGFDTLGLAGRAIAERTDAGFAAVVSVPPVGRRYGAALARSLRSAGLRTRRFEVPDGDRTKSLHQAGRLCEALIEAGIDRSGAVVALGGGMVGDLAGFAAATVLRGVSFVQVPTSLLAMVDASVGGKVGVNVPQGKNLVGAFHQPRLVWIDLATLRSLPPRERAAGFAEVLKKAAIWDAELFARLERDAEALMRLEPGPLLDVVERACAIKAEVVSRDEREGDLRMLLNFGHTLAHAIERQQRYRGILHGEAVAIGMVYAALRSEELGFAPAGTADRIAELARRFGLPTDPPAFARSAYLSAVGVDKKRQASRIRFVVLQGIGSADTYPLTPAEIVQSLPRDPGRRRTEARRGR